MNAAETILDMFLGMWVNKGHFCDSVTVTEQIANQENQRLSHSI